MKERGLCTVWKISKNYVPKTVVKIQRCFHTTNADNACIPPWNL